MIYPTECDIVHFLRSLSQALLPYAKTNEINISFSTGVKKLDTSYQPFELSQSFCHLVCNMISLLPPKSNIEVRLLHSPGDNTILIEIENTSINLIRVSEVGIQNFYTFMGKSLPNGTLYQLMLSINQEITTTGEETHANVARGNLPQFYKEVQRWFHTHFTQTEKLIATLEKTRPGEAAFMQRINAMILANLDDENFDSDALCRAMSLSRTQLFRRIKSLIRIAPAQHIKAMRLQKAKEYLETTDCTVSEIAFKTGFRNISHFTKIFKTQYGILPSIYRYNGKLATNE